MCIQHLCTWSLKEGYSQVEHVLVHFSLQEVHQKPSCLIPFAVMGVALVCLLFVCKLTVATGTISGLVLYANIVGPNRTIFLPVESTDVFSLHG